LVESPLLLRFDPCYRLGVEFLHDAIEDQGPRSVGMLVARQKLGEPVMLRDSGVRDLQASKALLPFGGVLARCQWVIEKFVEGADGLPECVDGDGFVRPEIVDKARDIRVGAGLAEAGVDGGEELGSGANPLFSVEGRGGCSEALFDSGEDVLEVV